MDELLDDVYERMRGTGPEFQGWLSNHGPMAADALLRMGRRDMVGAWLEDYASRLEDEPRPRWPIKEAEWQDVIGDSSRLADWCALFTRQVHEEAWPELLARWCPRLLPGAIAAAAHGLIRTGHAVRALQEDVTPQRLDELAQGLGYWAARWQRLPLEPRPAGSADTLAALSAVPTIAGPGGVRARLKELERTPEWPPAVTSLRPVTNPTTCPAHWRGWSMPRSRDITTGPTATRSCWSTLPLGHVLPRSFCLRCPSTCGYRPMTCCGQSPRRSGPHTDHGKTRHRYQRTKRLPARRRM